MEVSPAACNEVDDRMWKEGEEWVSYAAELEPDQLLTAGEIRERYGIEVYKVRSWARRHPDKITTHKRGRRVFFLLREVLSYAAGME